MAKEGLIQQKQTQAVQTPQKTLRDLIESMKGEIARALPSVITPERFTRIVFSAISSNPKLAECTPKSFLGAMMQAAQMGLEPNTTLQQCFLIPYRNKGVMEVQFQLGYRGLIDLVWRSGEVSSIQAQVVYANDEFEYELGLEPKLRHVPATGDRGEAVYYYAVFKTKSGGYGFEVMSRRDMEEHARMYSKAVDYGPWKTSFDEMARKTILKKCLKTQKTL